MDGHYKRNGMKSVMCIGMLLFIIIIWIYVLFIVDGSFIARVSHCKRYVIYMMCVHIPRHSEMNVLSTSQCIEQ